MHDNAAAETGGVVVSGDLLRLASAYDSVASVAVVVVVVLIHRQRHSVT